MELAIGKRRAPGRGGEGPGPEAGPEAGSETSVEARSAGEALCLSCGLCCSGAIFDHVVLRDQSEAARMESIGLETRDGARLPQPCTAFQAMSCAVYQRRPLACRSFRCRLLDRLAGGELSPQQAGDIVARAHAARERAFEAASAFMPAARAQSMHAVETELVRRMANAPSDSDRQPYAQALLLLGVVARIIADHFWKGERWISR